MKTTHTTTRLRHHGGVAALAVAAAALLSSCGAAETVAPQGSASPSSQAIDSDEDFSGYGSAIDEYRATAATLELPEGQTYPDTPRMLDTDVEGSYQAGYGSLAAVDVWSCAWGVAYLDAVGTDAEYDMLARYAEIEETSVFTNNFAAELQQSITQSIEDAELGDPSAISVDISTNCDAPAGDQ